MTLLAISHADLNTVLIIAVAIFSSVTAPLIMVMITERQRRKEKLQDWQREDRVAEEAAKAAKLLAKNTAQASRSAERAEVGAARSEAKLDQIHTLVNSNLTAALNAELNATVALLENLVAADEPGSEVRIDKLRATVAELRANLEDRLKQTALAEEQLHHQ